MEVPTNTLSPTLTTQPTEGLKVTTTATVALTQTPTSEPILENGGFGVIPTSVYELGNNQWAFDLDPTCTPACWKDLGVSDATMESVTETMETELGISSSREPFLSDQPLPPNTDWIAYGWNYRNSDAPIPDNVVEFGFRDNVLMHIFLTTTWPLWPQEENDEPEPFGPQDFLELAGQPDWIYISPFIGRQIYSVSLIFGYDEGIIANFVNTVESPSFCLDSDFDFVYSRMSIGEPFSSIEELPLAYARYHQFTLDEARPIEEVVLNTSVEDIMAKVETGQSVCFTAEVEN